MRKKIYSFIKNEENEEKVFQYIQSNLVDNFNDKGIAKKWAKRAYELLFKEAPGTMEHAYLGLKVIYKETTKEVEPKNTRKK